jgi:hypothetical protein
MPLYITLQHLLNVLVQIANKMGNKKEVPECVIIDCADYYNCQYNYDYQDAQYFQAV